MKMFFWSQGSGYIQDSHGSIALTSKPLFSFEYFDISYSEQGKNYRLVEGGDYVTLTQAMVDEIDLFISNERQLYGVRKPCVDRDGNYLGVVDITGANVFKSVVMSPPNEDPYIYDFEAEVWRKKYFYDAQGYFHKDESTDTAGFTVVEPPLNLTPLVFKWNSVSNTWEVDYSNAQVIKNKLLISVLFNLITNQLLSLKNSEDGDELLIKNIQSVLTNIATFEYHADVEKLHNDYTELLSKTNLEDMIVMFDLMKIKNQTSVYNTTPTTSVVDRFVIDSLVQ